MSQADRDFVKAVDVTFANVANILAVSRQAVSRGVQKDDNDYFKAPDLKRILSVFEKDDRVRFQLAQRSIAELYPKTAREILRLIDANAGQAFDSRIPGNFTLVTADFVNFMGKIGACRQQLEEVTTSLRRQPGQLKIVIGAADLERVETYRSNIALEHKEQLISINVCKLDLALFPTCLMRITSDYKIDIYIAGDTGFVPLSVSESDRIKASIERIQLDSKDH